MGKSYKNDIKNTIVELHNNGEKVSDLSDEYGVSRTAIYQWIKNKKVISNEGGEKITHKDVLELKKKLAKEQEKNEILKKALAIFAKK